MSKYNKIDKIKITNKYLIDYVNLKEGLIKNQKNFADKKIFNRFLNKQDLGFPIVLPKKNKCFNGLSLEYKIKKNIVKKKIFKVNKNYQPLNNFFILGNSFSVPSKPKKNFLKIINSIKLINNETKNKIDFYKKKKKILGAFQTRNLPHFGHEKILELLFSKCDYVFINPLLGPKKKGDINGDVLSKVYNFFIKNSFNSRLIYGPICANMHYAGPREAIHHALIREKLGFDYFIVGRDHAGAENIYKPNQAMNLIKKYRNIFKIKIIVHKGAAFCTKCNRTIIVGDCNHNKYFEDISGNDFRKCIGQKKMYKYANINLQKYIHKLKF